MASRFEHILVGTEFSKESRVAIATAGRLARARGAQIELVHVIPLQDVPVYRIAGWEQDRRRVADDATRRLAAVASATQAKYRVRTRAYVAFGVPAEQIATRAEASSADLVVVGAHRKRPLRDIFIGSTAQRLQQLLSVALLVAGSGGARAHAGALVAVDLSGESAAAARAAATLYPDLPLHFVHVHNPPFESRLSTAGVERDAILRYRSGALGEAGDDLEAFIVRNGLQGRRASSRVLRGHPPSVIEKAAAGLGVSLIVLGSSRKSRLEAGLLGSVGEDVLARTPYDVLMVKPAPAMIA
jgi:universal stress protein E